MAEGAGIDVSGLPIGRAADQFLNLPQPTGAIIIFEAAAIVFLVWWLIRVYHDKDVALVAKDKELAEAKAAHIADLKLNIPAMQELRETILSLVQRGRRTP